MANSKKLINYIETHAEQFALRLLNLQWPARINLSVTDIDLSMTIRGRQYKGRGTSPESDLAIIKAFVEAYERSLLDTYHYDSSNGLAGHVCRNEARKRAAFELYERHIFFSNFEEEIPFVIANFNLLGFRNASAAQNLQKQGTEVILSVSQHGEQGFFALVVLDGKSATKPYGLIIGTAFSETMSVAVDSAFVEALRYHFYVQDYSERTSLTTLEFDALSFVSIDDHAKVGLNVEYSDWFKTTYLTNSRGATALALPEPKIEDLVLDDQSLPLHYARAYGPEFRTIKLGGRSQSGFPHPFR